MIKLIRFTSFPALVSELKTALDEAYISLPVRRLAEVITRGTGKDYDAKIRRISDFLSSNTTFNRDPVRWEYLQTPGFLAGRLIQGEHVSGDCEDLTMLTLALAKSIGIPGYMVFVSPGQTHKYTHVFAVAESPMTKRLFQIDMQKTGKVYEGDVLAVSA